MTTVEVAIAGGFFCLTIAAIEITNFRERREMVRKHQEETVRFRDERNELIYQIRDLTDAFAKERAELLDRLTAESFRDFKSQQIRMTRAQNKAEPEHPNFELL